MTNNPRGSEQPSCKIPGCGIIRGDNTKGYCVVHHDAFLTRTFELTQDIGRGTHA